MAGVCGRGAGGAPSSARPTCAAAATGDGWTRCSPTHAHTHTMPSLSLLPSGSFDLLIYTDKDSEVPLEWCVGAGRRERKKRGRGGGRAVRPCWPRSALALSHLATPHLLSHPHPTPPSQGGLGRPPDRGRGERAPAVVLHEGAPGGHGGLVPGRRGGGGPVLREKGKKGEGVCRVRCVCVCVARREGVCVCARVFQVERGRGRGRGRRGVRGLPRAWREREGGVGPPRSPSLAIAFLSSVSLPQQRARCSWPSDPVPACGLRLSSGPGAPSAGRRRARW